jgi:microcystin-dependent protein
MVLDKFKVKNGIDVTGSQTSSGIITQEESTASGYSFIPSGTIALWPSSTVPDGWLECDGSEIEISGAYNSLYVSITANGTVFPFGANTNGSGGAGSTYFRLPNLSGRVAISTKPIDYVTGQWGGSTSITITNDIISHQHTMSHTHQIPHAHSTPGHDGATHFSSNHTHTVGSHTHNVPATLENSPHNHAGYFDNTGGSGTAFRLQSSPNSPAVNVTASGVHQHAAGSNAGLTDVTDTSGDSLSQATGSGGGTSNTPSQPNVSTHPGASTTINVIQKSYSLMYVIKV